MIFLQAGRERATEAPYGVRPVRKPIAIDQRQHARGESNGPSYASACVP